jgi:hypothetical protein
MKRFTRAFAVTLAAMMIMALAVAANHTAILSFSANPVTEGTSVTVTFGSSGATGSGIEGNAKLFVCQLTDANASVLPGEYGPTATCGTGDPEAAPVANAGAWVQLAQVAGGTTTTYNFATTGLGGYTIGFMTNDPPVNSGHLASRITLDLVVNSPAPTGDSHPGCNGVENAYSQVTTNNGAGKGKAAEALEKVAQKLGCDLAP